MAATVTGTPVAITSTSQSVTVPSGCKAAIFTWSYYNAGSGHGLASATLNGASPDATAEAATGAGGADASATGIAVFLAPTTGSQTFAHSFDAATSEGPTRVLTFLTADNAVALRGSLQAANASGSSAVDVTLTGLTAGDLAVAHDQTYNVIPGNQSGWTSHQTGTVNSEGFRLRSIAAAGSSVTASAQSLGYASIAAGAFYDAGGGGADPTITDVDTDEIVLDGQTSVAVTGTDLGTTNADRAFTLRQGSTSVPQTETGTGTATAATLTIGIEQTGADIKFGAATLRVTRTSDSAFGDLALTVNPPTGQIYVDIGTPNATSADRITAVADIASGDQIQYRGVGGGAAPTGLTINTDATWQFSSGNTPAAFDVRVWDASDSTWGAWATQGIAGDGVAIEAGFDSLTITEMQASIELSRSIAAGLDSLVLTERTAAVALSRAVAANLDVLTITERQAVTRLSRNIAAGLDSLVITELAAQVSAGQGIEATADTLVITEHPASVNRGVVLAAGVDVLAIAEQVATLRLAKAIAAGVDSLLITERQAAVSTGLAIAAGSDSLALTERTAQIRLARDVQAGADALVLTERQASVSTGLAISAGADALLISEHAALVNRERDLQAGFDALSLTERQAAVNLARVVEAGIDSLVVSEHDAIVVLGRAILAGFDALTIEEQQAIVQGQSAVIEVVAHRIVRVAARNNVVSVPARRGITVH